MTTVKPSLTDPLAAGSAMAAGVSSGRHMPDGKTAPARLKRFRIHHERSIGTRFVLIMQYRLVESDTAEHALRGAMRHLSEDNSHFEVRSENLAIAQRFSPTTYFDIWKAELE